MPRYSTLTLCITMYMSRWEYRTPTHFLNISRHQINIRVKSWAVTLILFLPRIRKMIAGYQQGCARHIITLCTVVYTAYRDNCAHCFANAKLLSMCVCVGVCINVWCKTWVVLSFSCEVSDGICHLSQVWPCHLCHSCLFVSRVTLPVMWHCHPCHILSHYHRCHFLTDVCVNFNARLTGRICRGLLQFRLVFTKKG